MMKNEAPEWIDPKSLLEISSSATESDAIAALSAASPDATTMATLISPAAAPLIEEMAKKAQLLTRRHFGRTISLYAPLYLSNYCSSGCTYCGFASDRDQPRRKLDFEEIESELEAMRAQGFEDILLLTGERCAEADFNYVLKAVSMASRIFHNVSIESFSMSEEEYGELYKAGCTGITLYQETYNPDLFDDLHRWGAKKDYLKRLQAPSNALDAGMRGVGIGALLGLDDPVRDSLCVYMHARHLLKKHWRSGIMISFPRICEQQGDYQSLHNIPDALFARIIFAFRICLPEVPLVLSTREPEAFRDGIAGIGISRMSVASQTTVGGYSSSDYTPGKQFSVNDTRDVKSFCAMLKERDLEPVFKNWDSVFNC